MNFSGTTVTNQKTNRFSSPPAGYLLGKFGLLTVLAGLLLAIWYQQVVIVILLGLVLSAAGLARLWSRLSLAGVTCERLLSRRRIHWKASARHQHLQVKVFEPTTTLKAALFLAVDSFKHRHGEGYGGDDFELGISVAASIANHLIMEQRSAVGLLVNSRLADSGQPVRISPGSSASQLVRILEALAKVTHLASQPMEEFIQAERIGLPWGTALVFVLSRPSPSLTELLAGLKESGHKLLVLQVGDREGSEIERSIAYHNVRQPGDFMKVTIGETK